MAQKRKTDCTPEEWAAYLAKVRAYRNANLEGYRARQREYERRPEVKAKKREYDARPDRAEQRRKNHTTQRAKMMAEMRRKARWATILASQRARRTGFTPELIERVRKHQRNRCAICRRQFTTDMKLCADHCYDTRAPRGLLCHNCNIIEGMLRGVRLTPGEFLRRLKAYLASPPALSVMSKLRQASTPCSKAGRRSESGSRGTW